MLSLIPSKDIDKDIIKKKSNIPFGRGTIIIESIATKSATTIKSFENIFFMFIYNYIVASYFKKLTSDNSFVLLIVE